MVYLVVIATWLAYEFAQFYRRTWLALTVGLPSALPVYVFCVGPREVHLRRKGD